MVDNKTRFLKLPLPNVDNELEDDCPRFEKAFNMLDAHAAAGDARLENVETQAGNLEQRAASNEGTLGTLEGRASALESKLGETSATLQAHGTALQNCDAALRDHAEGLIDLSNNKASKEELEVIESSVTAISTTLIGSVLSITAAEGYVPNGTVPADAAEYTREQFREFYDTYLAGGKLLTCTYAAFAAQVALTGNCAKFALDKDAQKFKVPLVKNGDSITQAASAAELGKSVKAGLPNITAEWGYARGDGGGSLLFGGGAVSTSVTASGGTAGTAMVAGGKYILNVGSQNSIFGNSTTVTDEQVRWRHFVVLASAQNSASVFDWSNYMAGLAGKANLDMDNLSQAGTTAISHYVKPSNRRVNMALPSVNGGAMPMPGDGTLQIMFYGANAFVAINNNTTSIQEAATTTFNSSVNATSLTLPVSKDDSVAVWWGGTSITITSLSFNFDRGAY